MERSTPINNIVKLYDLAFCPEWRNIFMKLGGGECIMVVILAKVIPEFGNNQMNTSCEKRYIEDTRYSQQLACIHSHSHRVMTDPRALYSYVTQAGRSILTFCETSITLCVIIMYKIMAQRGHYLRTNV